MCGGIAAAVEQQSSATEEISRNVQEASASTSEVSTNISEVTSAAAQSGESAKTMLTAANQLAEQSKALSGQVDTFLASIRASLPRPPAQPRPEARRGGKEWVR